MMFWLIHVSNMSSGGVARAPSGTRGTVANSRVYRSVTRAAIQRYKTC